MNCPNCQRPMLDQTQTSDDATCTTWICSEHGHTAPLRPNATPAEIHAAFVARGWTPQWTAEGTYAISLGKRYQPVHIDRAAMKQSDAFVAKLREETDAAPAAMAQRQDVGSLCTQPECSEIHWRKTDATKRAFALSEAPHYTAAGYAKAGLLMADAVAKAMAMPIVAPAPMVPITDDRTTEVDAAAFWQRQKKLTDEMAKSMPSMQWIIETPKREPKKRWRPAPKDDCPTCLQLYAGVYPSRVDCHHCRACGVGLLLCQEEIPSGKMCTNTQCTEMHSAAGYCQGIRDGKQCAETAPADGVIRHPWRCAACAVPLYDGWTAEECLERYESRQRNDQGDPYIVYTHLSACQLAAARELWATQLRQRVAAGREQDRQREVSVRVEVDDE